MKYNTPAILGKWENHFPRARVRRDIVINVLSEGVNNNAASSRRRTSGKMVPLFLQKVVNENCVLAVLS